MSTPTKTTMREIREKFPFTKTDVRKHYGSINRRAFMEFCPDPDWRSDCGTRWRFAEMPRIEVPWVVAGPCPAEITVRPWGAEKGYVYFQSDDHSACAEAIRRFIKRASGYPRKSAKWANDLFREIEKEMKP